MALHTARVQAQRPARADVLPGGASAAPADLSLKSEGERRAKALSLFYRAQRMEREVSDEAALKLYLEALEADPKSSRLVARITRLYLDLNRFNEALALHEKCVTLNPQDPAPLISLSRFCRKNAAGVDEIRGRALTSAQTAVEKFPHSAEAWENLCDIHLAEKDKEKAQAAVKQAQASGATDPEFWLQLAPVARIAFPGGRGVEEAVREQNLAVEASFYEKALSLAPQNTDVVFRVADFYRRNGNVEKAMPLYRQLVVAAPDNLDARRRYGLCLAAVDKDDEALKVFSDLVRINNQDATAHQKLVELYEKRKDVKSALTHRAEILRLEGGDADEYADLARGMMNADETRDALTLLKRGLFHHGKSGLLMYLAATAESRLGNRAEALTAFQAAADLADKFQKKLLDHQFYLDWATAKDASGDEPGAAELYRQSASLVPKDKPELGARPYASLARLWLRGEKNIEEAGELIRTAEALAKEDPLVLECAGWHLLLKKNYPAAVEKLTAAAAAAKKPAASVLDLLAQALAATGKPDLAVKQLEKAVALPDATDAMRTRLEDYRKEAAAAKKPAAEPADPKKSASVSPAAPAPAAQAAPALNAVPVAAPVPALPAPPAPAAASEGTKP